jgi:general secretion pathway protein G
MKTAIAAVSLLVVVLAVVGSRVDSVDKEVVAGARAQIQGLMGALGTYKLDNGTFPTTEQGLQALRVKPADAPHWNGPYLPQEVPKDPWDHNWIYKFPGDHGNEPDIISYGADGRPGGDGVNVDIVSWKKP